jgi:ABC-type transporter Mla subunit MlaD
MARRLTDALNCLIQVPDGLAGTFADVTHGLAGTFADVTDGLAGTFADVADGLAGTFADIADGLAGAFADAADGPAGAFADLTNALAGALTDVLEGLLGALAGILDGLAGLAEHVAATGADVLDRRTEALQQLRITVERRHHAVHDGRHVVETDLHERLRLDPANVQADPPEVDVNADLELDEVEHVCV